MYTQIAPPLTQHAFDDPGTQQHWTRTFRRTLTNLLVRVAIWAALLITSKVAEDDTIAGAASFFFMISAFLLLGPSFKLRWLLVVRRVLRFGPWRAATAVRRPDVKHRHGKAVELLIDYEYGDGPEQHAGGGSPVLRKESAGPEGGAAAVAPGAVLAGARTWRGGIPWTDELSHGAWVVLGPRRQPVLLARPGGSGFMTLHGS
ncbi:hypothetical protein [Streptomyces cavernicola]|uniref:Uncharacterized protein n=1 Tax=Streptomyces cavernicola TaxID=3043613 RepID=A0ABT6S731_9ACTN|nr:hypothetical protein [Streptomyces sp. B-S-A6]MDI3403852.1 hypothetical protein [Streptomyces sp. B-S-A6]